jgi:hypothetical protein
LSSLSALPCNPSNRPLAICAHKANAAELLDMLQFESSATSNAASSKHSSKQQPSLQEQMTALWKHGITCFDVDVVQLAGGDYVIGHPADLAQKASSSSSNRVKPEQLHQHTLAELRAAGVDAAAAPGLHVVLQHFAQLRRNKPHGGKQYMARLKPGRSSSSSRSSSSTVVGAATQRDNWQHIPLLALELKGPASVNLEAWKGVIRAVKSAGVADSTMLWLRQPAGAGGSSSNGGSSGRPTKGLQEVTGAVPAAVSNSSGSRSSVVLQLAHSLRNHITRSSSSKGRHSMVRKGPLLGLIVPDQLLSTDASLTSAASPAVR